jgi:hypothetical protein
MLVLLAGSIGGARLSAQEKTDYNDIYKYPLSIGVSYQSLSPFGDYMTDFTSYYDLSAILRAPLPKVPVLQPLLHGGMIRFVTPEAADQSKWEHTHWYLTAGLAACRTCGS